MKTQWTSLMMTESDKIQGTAWDFGSLEGYLRKWGNYDVTNLPRRTGTDDYRAYMAAKEKANGNVFQPALSGRSRSRRAERRAGRRSPISAGWRVRKALCCRFTSN